MAVYAGARSVPGERAAAEAALAGLFSGIPHWETWPGGLLERHAAYRPHLTDSREWPTLVSLRRLPPETDWLPGGGEIPDARGRSQHAAARRVLRSNEECP
jgi:hypothetical protein